MLSTYVCEGFFLLPVGLWYVLQRIGVMVFKCPYFACAKSFQWVLIDASVGPEFLIGTHGTLQNDGDDVREKKQYFIHSPPLKYILFVYRAPHHLTTSMQTNRRTGPHSHDYRSHTNALAKYLRANKNLLKWSPSDYTLSTIIRTTVDRGIGRVES